MQGAPLTQARTAELIRQGKLDSMVTRQSGADVDASSTWRRLSVVRGAGAGRGRAANEPGANGLAGSRFAGVGFPREVSKNRPDQRSYNECTEKLD